MKIYLDGDGCPIIKIAEKVAKKHNIKSIIVCDVSHYYESEYSEIIKVGSGADYADLKIVNSVSEGDIVATNDMGLAALVLSKKCFVINFNGHIIDDNNIDLLLQSRYLNKLNINKGRYPKGQKKRTEKQNIAFELQLEKMMEAIWWK